MKLLTKKLTHRKFTGAALIISMIFVLIFSSFAVSLSSMCTNNVQIADNQRKADRAMASAESGLEILRLWMNNVSIPGNTPTSYRFGLLASSLASSAQAISNIYIDIDSDSQMMIIPTVNLGTTDKTFSATIIPLPSVSDPNILQVDITGTYNGITRRIKADFSFGQMANTVFNFGVASKGPLSLSGNIELEGVNVSVESSVYIESQNENLALSIIGNSQIAGEVSIVNPTANVFLQGGQAGIGGETGQEAIDNHVYLGVPPASFPIPNPSYFEHYVADTNTIDPSTDTSSDATFENVRIVAGTNPTFSGHVTLNGIVYIETPNVVTFTGDVDITGIIVGDGDYQDNSGVNQINILGSVVSYPVSSLPDEPQFSGVKNEGGTFILAPGFDISFGGNFNTLNGAIASNGVTFFGNAGGTINGSILNYSDDEMALSGNSDLFFNRSGAETNPPGFIPLLILIYEPKTYTEGPFREA